MVITKVLKSLVVLACAHEIVHDVIIVRYTAENVPDHAFLRARGHLLINKGKFLWY